MWAFDEFELDTAACQLRRRGRAVILQPRVFDTLKYLVENSARVVSRKELLDALWTGQNVNPGAVPWSINHVRRALGQRALDKYPIETIRGRGYRFVAPVSGPGTRAQQSESVRPAPVETLSDTGDGPFVGRADAMARLVEALRSARAGEGAIILLTGPQGIGKTRCMTELAGLAQSFGVGVWSGRCIAAGGAPGLFPFIRVLREACDDTTLPMPERAQAESLLSRLSPHPTASGAPVGEGVEPDPGRFWLLDELVHFLRRASEQRARLVLLDDLQDADASSVDVLSWLAPDIARTKLLVVASARPPATGGPSAGVALAARIGPARVQALSPWQEADVTRYLEGRIGGGVASGWGPSIYSLTAGNPLFVREAVSLLSHRRALSAQGELESGALPDVAQEILAHRAAMLEPSVRATLEVACVIGEQFDVVLLMRVAELPAPDLLYRLEAAVAARFLVPQPGVDRYEFAHGLIHAGLYDALPASRRVALHAQIARAIVATSVSEPRLYELAYHLYKGLPESGYECAIAQCRRAGDAAMQVYAYEDAVKFYTWALAAQGYAEKPVARDTCEILQSNALALRRAGRYDESLLYCARAIDIATQEGFADLLLEAACHLRPTVWMAPVPDLLSLRALTRALELFPEEAKAERARAYALLSCLPPHSCSVDESRALAKKAVDLARELGNSKLLAETLCAQLYGYSGPDAVEELLRISDEILRVNGPQTSWWAAEVFIGRFLAFLQLGDLVGAQRALTAFGEVVHQLKMPEAIWQYESRCALLRFHAGELEYAEARFDELADQAKRLHLSYARFNYEYQAKALRVERRGHPWFAGSPGPLHDAEWAWARAIPVHRADRIVHLIEAGATAEARVEFASLAADGFAGVTRDLAYLYTLVKLALAAVALEEREQARILYEKLLPYARYNPVHGWGFYLGSVSYFLGALARFLGEPAAAADHYEAALEMLRSLGYKSQILRTQLALAELSEASPPRGERNGERTTAEQVRIAARKLGMVGLAERATEVAAGR